MLAVAVLFVLQEFFKIPSSNILVTMTVVTFFICLPYMSLFPMIMSFLSVIIGHLLFFLCEGDLYYWKDSIVNNLGMVVLFVAAPLLSYPLKHGGYVEYMYKFVNNYMKNNLIQVTFITTLTCVLSSFLNLGAARFVYELFFDKVTKMKRLFTSGITQGFSLAALWSPYFAGVAIILHLLEVPFTSFFLYGLLTVALGLTVSTLLVSWEFHKGIKKSRAIIREVSAGADLASGFSSEQYPLMSHRKGWELIIVFIGLFVTLILLERWLNYNLILLISVIAFFYSIIWSLAIRKGKEYARSIKNDYIVHILPGVHNESIMFISGAFFAQMIQLTPFTSYLSSFFERIASMSTFLMVLTIIVIVVSGSTVVHQVLPITVLATSLSPEVIGLSSELFALTLIISWGISPLISPLAALNLITTNLLHLKMFELGKWNLKYIVIVVISFSAVISIMNILE
ncbi:hypothetical protein J2S00_003662 [Caldalkalibacillus uzonensis]|uniref:Citrate transporter-like domain-containing protein n=1 Tax=Caldalkalibacillus uzonensis TaxID=353224 RepID=A0ABU0CWM5_9BACI|nr:hypothetical protein [Caldalkalibacillus uzonensis]MDQ0340822.1 hypothetical protein [Caldalkalibacillus uzonensis]